MFYPNKTADLDNLSHKKVMTKSINNVFSFSPYIFLFFDSICKYMGPMSEWPSACHWPERIRTSCKLSI